MYSGGVVGLYPATVIDICSPRLLGLSIAEQMRKELVNDALEMAVVTRSGGVIPHSGRGAQGGFNRSSQHLDHGGSRWDVVGSRFRRRLRVRGGSGRRIER